MKKRIAILASGAGSNLVAILESIKAKKLNAECGLVFSDRPGAPCLEKARRLGIKQVVSFSPKAFPDKMTYESRLMEVIEAQEIDYVVLAGYMRILSPRFVRRFEGRVVNIHPALLPAFKGARGIRDAFEAKVEKTGVTVHFVTAEVDGGPVILQEEVPIRADDTLESLEARIHETEHGLYTRALKLVLEGKVKFENHTVVRTGE